MPITDMQLDNLWCDSLVRQMFEEETHTAPLPPPSDKGISTRHLAVLLESYHVKFIHWARERFKNRNFSPKKQDVLR